MRKCTRENVQNLEDEIGELIGFADFNPSKLAVLSAEIVRLKEINRRQAERIDALSRLLRRTEGLDERHIVISGD